MIPRWIKRNHILLIIKELSTQPPLKINKYYVEYEGKKFPPKFLISQAHQYVDGNIHSTKLFSGGNETNEYLRRLGFEIKENSRSLKVTSCVLELSRKETLYSRKQTMERVIRNCSKDCNVLLLPAGTFTLKTRSKKGVFNIIQYVQRLLKIYKCETTVVFGVDSKGQMEQYGIALNSQKVLGMGRKFFATLNENINVAPHYMTGEYNHPRIFSVKGFCFYLSICYDNFSIARGIVQKPNVDAIMCLIHDFYARPKQGSGEVYFVKNGIAGASKKWNVPVFNSVVWKNRIFPQNYPCCVNWKSGDLSTQRWKYSDNDIKEESKKQIDYERENLIFINYTLRRKG